MRMHLDMAYNNASIFSFAGGLHHDMLHRLEQCFSSSLRGFRSKQFYQHVLLDSLSPVTSSDCRALDDRFLIRRRQL